MEVGRSIPRVDAADKVTGRAKYTDDLCPRPVLEAKILHSTIANGWVKSMDISAAQALPGVVKVLTCFDVPDIQYPTPGHPWSVEKAHQDVSDRKLLNRRVRIYGDDIAAVVEIAHKHGIKVFIDNTFATPYNTTPLDLGVDAVIHSLTKYIGGHGDLLGGAVISNDEQFLRECRLGTLMHFGSVMAPFTAFLVCRGLKTLGVRMKQYNESALKIAKWLEANPKIETVRYPFLESNPQYAIAKKQMKGGGGMISFDVAGGLEAGKKFINSLKLCTLAVSLGDTETLVEQAAAMTHTMIPKEIREAAGITDGMIRMSVGLEDPDDIIADLKQALGD